MYSGFRLTNELAEIARAEVEKQKQEIFQIQNQGLDSDSDDDIEIISSNVSDEVYNDTRILGKKQNYCAVLCGIAFNMLQ